MFTMSFITRHAPAARFAADYVVFMRTMRVAEDER